MARELTGRFPAAAELPAEAAPDLLAFTAFPVEHRRQMLGNASHEWLNRAAKRHTYVAGSFPNAAAPRLVGQARILARVLRDGI